MITKGSRVTLYEDEDHEFSGVVVDMLADRDDGTVLVQFDEDPPGFPEEVDFNSLEED